MVKKIIFALACSFALCIQNTSAAESLDGIVATVNDTVITKSELNQTMQGFKKQLAANHVTPPAKAVLYKQVLDQLINKKLQIQAAEQAGLRVSDEEVEKAITGIANDHKISVDQLYKEVAAQGDLSPSAYRKEIHDQLLLQQIQQQEVGSKISINEEEIKSLLHSKLYQATNTKEYHLEDILIALPDAPSPEQVMDAKKRAQALLAKINKGLNFAEAAAAESANSSAAQGGDLGWRKLPEIPSAFAGQLVQMQTNEIMGPIQTPNGFHLVKLTGVRNFKDNENADDQKKQVQQLVFQRKMEEGMQNWVTRLRSAASINLHPDA